MFNWWKKNKEKFCKPFKAILVKIALKLSGSLMLSIVFNFWECFEGNKALYASGI